MKKDSVFFFISLLIFFSSMIILVDTLNSLFEFRQMTGNSVSSGLINLSIEQVVLVNFTVDNVNWGSGAVDLSATNAIIDTMGNVIGGNWDPVASGFIIENIGNSNISLNFSSLKNATDFIGGDNPSYQYRISDIEPGACIPPDEFTLDNFYEFPASGNSVAICEYFLPGESILFDLNLTIPYNSNTGSLSDIITLAFQQN